MTEQDVREQVGDRLHGTIEAHSRTEAEIVLKTLHAMGYQWQLLWRGVPGNDVTVAYFYNPDTAHFASEESKHDG